MPVYASRLHSDAFLAAVSAIWPRVGDASAPADVTLPYAVVYPLDAAFDGSMSDLDADADPITQITYVGATREQAQWLRDKVRTDLLGQFLVVSGRRVGPVRIQAERPVLQDRDVTPHLMYAIDRYRAWSTPA